MYKSLFAVLKPIVAYKSTGRLDIVYDRPPNGRIFLSKGSVTGISLGDVEGIDALKIMSKTLTFASFMTEEPLPNPTETKAYNTLNILKQLSKIEKFIPVILNNLGGNDTILSFDRRAIGKEVQFSPIELEISFALNGTNNIKQVMDRVDALELDILNTLMRFLKNKAASKVLSHSPMNEERRNRFIKPLEEILAEVTGPVAPVIITQSLEAIEGDKVALAFSDLPLLYATVGYHLEEDEKKELAKFAGEDPIWTELISS